MNIKYLIEYDDINGEETRIEILNKDYSGSPISLKGTGDPFIITMDSSEDKFVPVRGTGATLNVYSEDHFYLRDLYTDDIFKYPVRAIKNGNVFWNGYVNTEVYNEDYSMGSGYPVSIEMNDGLVLLNRLKYVDDSGNKYSGLISIWSLFQRIMKAMKLDHRYYFISLNKIPEGSTKTISETPLHLIQVNQNNYYDEDDEPLSYREVLDAVILPFGATLLKHDGAVHLLEVDKLADTSYNRNRYNSSFIYESVDIVNVNFDITTNKDIKFVNSDQQLDIIGGYNKQSITYSPYSVLDVINTPDISKRENITGEPTYTHYVGESYYRVTGFSSLDYKLFNGATIATHVDVLVSKPPHGAATRSPLITEKEEYYIFKDGINDHTKICSVTSDVLVTSSTKSTIKVSIDMFIETNGSPFSSDGKDEFNRLEYYISVKVGNKYLKQISAVRNGYVLSDTECWIKKQHNVERTKTINDSWITTEFALPLYNNRTQSATLLDYPLGKVEIGVKNTFKASKKVKADYVADISEELKHIRIKNIAVEVVKVVPLELNNAYTVSEADDDDIEIIGIVNKQFENEGSDITVIHGDSFHNNCTDRGAFYTTKNLYTECWISGTETIAYPISHLLLRSIINNYKTSLIQLNATLKASTMFVSSDNKSGNCLGFLSTISDTTYLGNKRLMCVGGSYSDVNREFSGTWVEVLEDKGMSIVFDV